MAYKSWKRTEKADQNRKAKATPPPFRNGRNRQKCKAALCPAMADPSDTGFCSYHNSQALNVGEPVKLVEQRRCRECKGLCEPPTPGMDEPDMCETCLDFAKQGSGELDDPIFEQGLRKPKQTVDDLLEDNSMIDAFKEMMKKERKYRDAANKPKSKSPLTDRLT